MKFRPKDSIKKFQMGGEMAPADGAEAPVEGAPAEGAPESAEGGQGGDPLMQVAQMAAQALQGQDCQAAMQVCQIFLEMVQQMQGGGGAPAGAEQGEPVFRKGGILVKRIKK
jgi:hypothetical protein